MTGVISPSSEPYPRRWPALAALLVAAAMNIVDISIVNVALPRLQSGLGATSSEIEWVVTAYVLAFALGLMPFGRLGDRIGRKTMFLAGVTGFTLFSALCGLAPGTDILIAARLFQGLTAAMMAPQVIAIAQVIFPPGERAFAFSFFGLTAGLASVAGPLIGGLLINADIFGLDWRPIFLVNIPVGIAAIVAARVLVPASEVHPNLQNDWGGIAIAVLATLLLIFPLVEGHALGWPDWTFVMLATGAAFVAVFAAYEKRQAARGLSQLLPATLLVNRSFLLGATMILIFFAGVMGVFLFLAIFLQQGFGFTPLASGLTTVPFPLGVLIASLMNGRIGARWYRQRIAVGALMLLFGMTYLRLVVDGVGDAVDHWNFVPPMLLSGLGMGITISPLMQITLASVPHHDAGSGAGALQSFQQLGGAFGIAVGGQLFFSNLTSRIAEGASAHPAFVSALSSALLFSMAAYLAVTVLVAFMRSPASPVQAAADVRRA